MAKRISTQDIVARKNAVPIVVLTAYTAPVAKLLDPHVDILLVGDSLGMVVYGMKDTLDTTVDMMIAHGRAVMNASAKALVVIDMPYGSYESSKELALVSAQRIMRETGAQAVKLEGGKDRAEIIRHLVANGIPVMGHVGLLPQRVREMGGYKTQGKTPEEAEKMLQDALAIESAGVFAIVIEGTKEEAARHITGKLRVPTIGIGASPACDGQVLVIDDMLGLSGYIPSFVKHYADVATMITQAVEAYAEEVKNRTFPSAEYCYPFGKKSKASTPSEFEEN
jgi:3-methyl-2-oxobutanoate hydroxymethyltransferase